MILIKNGYIKTITNGDIEKGCVLIDDNGKLKKIAKNTGHSLYTVL